MAFDVFFKNWRFWEIQARRLISDERLVASGEND
jgi:hypothetical protein